MKNSQSLGEKILQGSIIAIIFTFIGSASAYFVRVVYSRSLSVEMFGLFFAVFGFFNIISSYTELGFGQAIAYFVPKHLKLKKYKELWNTFIYGQAIQVGVAILFSLILIIFAPVLSVKYFKVSGSETLIYIFCAFLILTSILNSLLQIFTGLQKVRYYSSLNALRMFFVLLFSLIFLFLGLNNINFYGLSWVLGYLITTMIYLYLLWVTHPHLTSNVPVWQKEIFQTMYKYALPAFISTIVFSLITASDVFFLTLFKGVKEVGIYSIIVPLASISIIFLSPLNNVLFPLVSHLCEGEKDKLSFLINKIYELVPFIGVYFALFIVMFPSSTIGLIFGQKWLGVSEVPLVILSLGSIANLVVGILSTITLGIGKTKERLKVYIFTAIIIVCLHLILIRQFGVLGAVSANTIAYFGLSVVFTKLIKDVVYIKIPYSFYLKMLIVSVISLFAVRISGFLPKDLLEFILSGVVYSVIFVLFGYILNVYDKKLLVMILPKKRS